MTCDMNSTEFSEPPTHLFSDYVEMAYLAILVILGIPLNVFILLKLIKDMKYTQKDSVKAGFLLLKVHLNVSDILMLCIACGKLLWLTTYYWPGGDISCRVYFFLSMAALCISSNIVVCIALDRLRNVLYADQLHTGYKKLNPTNVVLTISWILAFVCALPQLIVFETYEVYPGWYQCTDVWQLHRHCDVCPNELLQPVLLSEYTENAYNITHLIIVFWGPLVLLLVSYLTIATRLMRFSSVTNRSEMRSSTCPIESSSRNGLPSSTEDYPRSSYEAKADKALQEEPNTPLLRNVNSHHMSPRVSKSDLKMPAWRKQLRSKVFRATLLVVLAHIIFWFPYNALTLMKYVNFALYRSLSEHAYIFNDMEFLITLINPFLYGFSA